MVDTGQYTYVLEKVHMGTDVEDAASLYHFLVMSGV